MSCLRFCQRQRKYYLNEWSDDSSDEEDIYNILTCNEDTPTGKKVSRSQSFTPKTSTVKFRRTPTLKKSSPKPKRCDSFDSFDSDCMYRITDTPQVLPLSSHYSPGDFIYGSPDACRNVATVRRACSFNTAPPNCRNISPIYNKQTRLPIPDSSVEIHSCSSESSTDSAFVDYDPSNRSDPSIRSNTSIRRHSSFTSPSSYQSPKPVIKVLRLPSMEKLSPASSTSSMSEVTVFQKVSSSSYASVPSSSCVSSRKPRPSTVVLVFPVGLENGNKPLSSDLNSPRTDTYRFSMANLQDTQDVDLDAILGELSALETQYDEAIKSEQSDNGSITSSSHSSGTGSSVKHRRTPSDVPQTGAIVRTESPDNDSAFSDSLSLLSSESSASSGARTMAQQNGKEEKIRLALEKMKQANVKKLFIKAFTSDGSAKSLLVDESMTCGYVTRLLAEKNHLAIDPRYERVYEDHEPLVDNLMLWTRDSKNKLFFVERPERTMLFQHPDLVANNSNSCIDDSLDEFTRNNMLEELLGSCGVPNVEGPLYLKTDSRKGWKKFHFVLRASGLYYYPKEKTRNPKDLVNLATFDVNQVYYGVGWRKKYKAPTEFCFAIKHPALQQPKSGKYMKQLAAEDGLTMHRWVLAIRIAKYGRQLLDNYKSIVEEVEILSEAGHSDSGSSGCDVAFENDFPNGTIKRKPPKLPLTATTRQLKELANLDRRVTLERTPSYSNLPPPPPELLASNTSLNELDLTPPPPPPRLSPPSTAFLADLQRVMRRKWQVAQKCKEDLATTPHEVLGFRDVPDYREMNVSNWIAEHYPTHSPSLYENVYRPGQTPSPPTPPTPTPSLTPSQLKKRPPPPPPRASTTQLSTPSPRLPQHC
ncbi:hypothetical protein M8J76_002825 [Diaphorina citri]|nr:hypothetical protein M8J75_010474 [Diaphorina citri]KAI5726446.1 hypothetical protein M8J76_002825 [Diaphorina citri]